MKKCNYFNRIGVAQMAALAITLPFQMLPVAEGATQPENIEVSDISCLCVRFAGVGETGIGKPIGTSGATRYELSGSAITVHVAPVETKGEAAILIDGKYGQVKLHAKIVLNVGAGTETTTTVSPYVFRAIAAGGGDYKTDVYMDGDGRVILERLDDGSTVMFDEHENPILKRNADGSTVYFDAYQSERMRINAHGDVDFNANVTGAGMRRVELVYDSAENKIKLNGVAQTYAQVEALIAYAGNFVTLQDGDDTSFLLPHYGDGAAIIFTGLDVFSTGDYSHRIAINSDEDVKREYFAIQRRKVAKVIANDVAEVMLNQDEVVIAEARTADLTVTLPYMAPKGAEFHLFIAVAGTPTITWPIGVTWSGGEAPTLENGKTVEVSFVNNFATSVTYENV